MPIGINNPLVRRVKRHASMTILFRAVESPRALPRPDARPPYVPPMVPSLSPPVEGEGISPADELSPLDRAILVAEQPTQVLQRAQAPPAPSVGRELSEPQASLTQESTLPNVPSPDVQAPSVQPQTEQSSVQPPATQQPSAPTPSIEDQDWDGAWGRLRNIFQRQEEKRAREEAAEENEPAAVQKQEPEKPRTIAEVQRRLNEPRVKGPVKRRRSTVEYIKPEEAAKPPQVQKTPQDPKSTAVVPSPETSDTSPATSEIQVEPGQDVPQDSPSEEVEKSETTIADSAEIAETALEQVASGQRQPEKTGQPPSSKVEKQSPDTIEEPSTEIEEPKKDEVAVAIAAAESPPPKQEQDQPTQTSELISDTVQAVQKSEAPTKDFTSISEPPDRPPEIEPAPDSEPDQPTQQDEGIGQRLLGAARRLLGSEPEVEPPVADQEHSQPVESASGAPEPVQRVAETEPKAESVSIVEEEPGTDLHEEFIEVEADDTVAKAIDQAERPPEIDASQPETLEQRASEPVVSLPAESKQPARSIQGEIDDTSEESAPTESSSVPEQASDDPETLASEEKLGPPVQALPATDGVDINQELTTKPPADVQKTSEPDSQLAEAITSAEQPGEPEDDSSLESQTDAEETIIMPATPSEGEPKPQTVPLQEAWPVQSSEPADEVSPTPEPISSPSSAEPVLQRRTAGGDESASQVEEALKQVQPSEHSDSAVELVTPRRPRPTISRKPAAEKPKQVSEQPTPEAPAPVDAPVEPPAQITDSASPADTGSAQRAIEEAEEGEDLPAPSPGPTRAPPPESKMVPTEIGDLPSDFWEILGQKPPETQQPGPSVKPTNGGLQRTPASPGDVSAAISFAEAPRADAPTLERPPLEDFIQREWSAPVVQREDLRSSSSSQTISSDQPSAETSGSAEDAESPAGDGVDVDKLAEAVYRQLKRRLAVERERGRGRF